MQFIWRPFSKHYDQSSEIYTHAFLNRYVWPEGFNLDRYKATGSNNRITEQNKKLKSEQFINYIKQNFQTSYKGHNLMVLMGDDFNYESAEYNYQQMELLMDGVNTNYPEYKVIYSTPTKYLQALFEEGQKFPVYYDDMFPYTEEGLSYWGGYYSSRPWIKQSVKTMSQTFHAASNLFAFNFLNH